MRRNGHQNPPRAPSSFDRGASGVPADPDGEALVLGLFRNGARKSAAVMCLKLKWQVDHIKPLCQGGRERQGQPSVSVSAVRQSQRRQIRCANAAVKSANPCALVVSMSSRIVIVLKRMNIPSNRSPLVGYSPMGSRPPAGIQRSPTSRCHPDRCSATRTSPRIWSVGVVVPIRRPDHVSHFQLHCLVLSLPDFRKKFRRARDASGRTGKTGKN